ncbi:hypothetical protein EDD85DRAFT_792180 [Armillaria nabsnona]|nr:hypothetical protein EDD85DRAFT_792180 [Armillaria nabsnona]
MDAYGTQLPFELVEIIISELWYSEHDSNVRIAFMTVCPLVCSLWRDVYASITSRDIYVPTIRHLFYLSSIIRSKKSSIYGPFLSESTRTIICHVNTIDSNNDSALFPYITFCHMPNYAGFRKCFPNIQCIRLQIKLISGLGMGDQIIRTQVSIRLDQVKTRLSVLPVDWYVAIDDPLDINEVDPLVLEKRWRCFLSLLLCEMHQLSWMLRSMLNVRSHSSAAERSTCSGGARHFCHRTYCKEGSQDIWGINHRFWKAGRKPTTHVKIFFSLIHDLFWLNHANVELPMWRDDWCSQGFQGSAMHGREFTVKHSTVVEIEKPLLLRLSACCQW